VSEGISEGFEAEKGGRVKRVEFREEVRRYLPSGFGDS
jgi:hypothetical protein